VEFAAVLVRGVVVSGRALLAADRASWIMIAAVYEAIACVIDQLAVVGIEWLGQGAFEQCGQVP
jgi:hypothetical protein